MENFNVMTEFWKILLDGLRKQGFSVMLLLGGVFGLWVMLKGQKEEMAAAIMTQSTECKQKILLLEGKIEDCDKDRRILEVQVAELKASLRPSVFKLK